MGRSQTKVSEVWRKIEQKKNNSVKNSETTMDKEQEGQQMQQETLITNNNNNNNNSTGEYIFGASKPPNQKRMVWVPIGKDRKVMAGVLKKKKKEVSMSHKVKLRRETVAARATVLGEATKKKVLKQTTKLTRRLRRIRNLS
jgi:hypothetical protein